MDFSFSLYFWVTKETHDACMTKEQSEYSSLLIKAVPSRNTNINRIQFIFEFTFHIVWETTANANNLRQQGPILALGDAIVNIGNAMGERLAK